MKRQLDRSQSSKERRIHPRKVDTNEGDRTEARKRPIEYNDRRGTDSCVQAFGRSPIFYMPQFQSLEVFSRPTLRQHLSCAGFALQVAYLESER